MTAKDAVSLAAKILSDHAQLFIDLSDIVNLPKIQKPEVNVSNTNDGEGRNILDLELSVRSYNCLKRAGINTLGDLTRMTPEQLVNVRNLGKKSLDEIMQKLADIGQPLSDNSEE